MDIYNTKLLALTKLELISKVCDLNMLLKTDLYKITLQCNQRSIAGVPVFISLLPANQKYLYLIEQKSNINIFHHLDLDRIDHISIDSELLIQSLFKKSVFDNTLAENVPSKLDLLRKLKQILENLNLASSKVKIDFLFEDIQPNEFLAINLVLDSLEKALIDIKAYDKDGDLKISGASVVFDRNTETTVTTNEGILTINSSLSDVIKERHTNIKQLIEQLF